MKAHKLGGLVVYVSPQDAEDWNCGGFSRDPLEIRCHLPLHEPDRMVGRSGYEEFIAGRPSDWYGTIKEAIAAGHLSENYYDECMEGVGMESAKQYD